MFSAASSGNVGRQLAYALCACALAISSVRVRAEEYDLQKIAEIAKAYHTSVNTFEVRTTTWVRLEPRYQKPAEEAEPKRGDPGVEERVESGEAPNMRYYRHSLWKDGQLVRINDEHFQNGELAYDMEKADIDPLQTVAVRITRSYRGEGEIPPVPEEIRHGLLLVDGSPFYTILSEPGTRLIGRKRINEVDCYEIQATIQSRMKTPLQATYYLDPTHDFLCARQVITDERGELVRSWETREFMRVASRWLPKHVVRAAMTFVDEKPIVTGEVHTVVAEVRINHEVDRKRFTPEIPDGAYVTDLTQGELVEYVQGGRDAAVRLRNRLEALRAEKSQLAPPKPVESHKGKRVVVAPPLSVVTWVSSAVAILSGSVILIACWLRYRRQAG